MDFVTIPARTHVLGWRFTLPNDIFDDDEQRAGINYRIQMCSPHRAASLPQFDVARAPVSLAEVVDLSAELDDVVDLAALCELVDLKLRPKHLRLPTEDELEAAAGGSLFPWGDTIPNGIPYRDETTFEKHLEPNSYGLQLLGDPYKVELSRTALKFGDGGFAICGGEPWPIAWLPLSPSFRLTDPDIAECFVETLESCFLRPVRSG